jgi:cysteine desulfurase
MSDANKIEHYFDWAATSPADPQILRDCLDKSLAFFGNPSSIHSLGTEARGVFEQARADCASALGVKPSTVFFTSGGTESDHIPLLALLARPGTSLGTSTSSACAPQTSGTKSRGTIIISGIEHPALREQCAQLKNLGYNAVTVNPDKNGFITPESIVSRITPDTLYITVMAVNNETGCIQPIYEIADAITKSCEGKRRPRFHVDCVQAAGKIPLDIAHKGIDSAAFSAHKICGPRGIGILYLAYELEPFMRGGGQEKNVRSGTENLFGALSFAQCLEKYWISTEGSAQQSCSASNDNAALHISSEHWQQTNSGLSHYVLQKKLTAEFINSLASIPSCTLVPPLRADLSAQEKFSPYVVQAAFKNIPGEVMVRALSSKGFYISTGSACSAKKQSRPILAAMKTPPEIQSTAVRFSFGPLTTEKGMSELIAAVKEVASAFNK